MYESKLMGQHLVSKIVLVTRARNYLMFEDYFLYVYSADRADRATCLL